MRRLKKHLHLTVDMAMIFSDGNRWIQQFAHDVQRQNARIPFKCLSRADSLVKGNTITPHWHAQDVLRHGWEQKSGRKKFFDAMEKGTTVEQIYESSRKQNRIISA